MKRIVNKLLYLIIFPVTTGLFLGISAIPSDLWYFSFIAFIPLLIAADWTKTSKKPLLVFAVQLAIALVVFYFWVYHWVLQTANLGFLIGFLIVLPYLVMVSPFILFKKQGSGLSPLFFIASWLTVELVQSFFELGSPFYNLGHNLGANPKMIQWYEFTGASGGTLWILSVNFLLYSLGYSLINNRKEWIKRSVTALLAIFLPIAISVLLYQGYKEKGPSSRVLIVHTGLDCYNVKYQTDVFSLMDIYLRVMLPGLNQKTEYVVLPETAITNAGWVSDFSRNLVFDQFIKNTVAYPNLKLVSGAVTYEPVPDEGKISGYRKIPGIRYSEKYKVWYYTYNSALQIEKGAPVQMRVKEGLVPYQEYAPYPEFLPRINPVGVDFQFSRREKNQQLFTGKDGRKTAALICYELVFSQKFNIAVREGAEALFVLMNEGWYSKVPKVPHQFLQLSVIRAIENRRSVAHSSNMGISAFINQRGDVTAITESKQSGFLDHEIRMNKKISIAALLGNFLGKAALLIWSALIIIKFISD